jgi:hypothetical protein
VTAMSRGPACIVVAAFELVVPCEPVEAAPSSGAGPRKFWPFGGGVLVLDAATALLVFVPVVVTALEVDARLLVLDGLVIAVLVDTAALEDVAAVEDTAALEDTAVLVFV